VNAEQPSVGDRARVRDREPTRALPSAHHARGAIPDDPRPQLRELVGRVAAVEHVEHVLELDAREVRERVRAPHERVQVVDRDLLVGADADDLLREHVERAARDLRLLDRAVEHPPRDHRGLEQVGPELREDAAARDRAELVAGAPDALQAARNRLRRLDLDDEVDRAHVDPELERRGRDEARDLTLLQQLLDLDPLLARERPVVRTGDLRRRRLRCRLGGGTGFAGVAVHRSQVVQPQRQTLGKAAVVDEHDRRAVRADELEDLGVDRRPDRLLLLGLAHVVERDDYLQVERLGAPGVDELDLAAAGDEPADLLQRSLGCGQADPLQRRADQVLQALQRQREMGATLRARDGVDLVDDHRLDPAQGLARA
jgi:hypothetical protein